MDICLPDFSKASVLVIGDCMLDRYWLGDTARISPEAPVPVVHVNHVDERPGGAGNVALNIAALGAKVTLLGQVGLDNEAKILEDALSALGVKHDLHHLAGISTTTKLRVISRHQQLIRLDFEEKTALNTTETLLHTFKKHLSSANLVILSDYGKGTLGNPSAFIELARQAQVPVLVDPKGRDFSIYRHANMITPNMKEFEAIVGCCHNAHDISTKAHRLLNDLDIDTLLLTRGEQGMTLIRKKEEDIHLPAHAREVFDVTGAGDTVIAMLGSALAAGETLENAMILANLAASLVVARLGAASVSTAELKAALQQQTAHTAGGVVNEEQLLEAVAEARLKGKKIVFTNGCFDILHEGHVTYLQQAKQLGDYLIVALNDDDSIKRLKGPYRPINNLHQRQAVLASLNVVDYVTSFSDDTPERLLKRLQPDILVKGGDYTPDTVVGAPIVYAYGGIVRVLGLVKDLSTTSIIDRIVQKQPT